MTAEAKKEKTEVKIARCVVKYLRVSPRKARLVIDTIRFKPVAKALAILKSLPQKSARMAEKALLSAQGNAKVLGMDMQRLYVSDVRADGGPVFKRFMSRSMGRADRILKRTTHLSLCLKEGERAYAPVQPAGVETPAVEEKPKKQKKEAKKKTPAKKKAGAV
jgi:large subunit ribosomal protein L22